MCHRWRRDPRARCAIDCPSGLSAEQCFAYRYPGGYSENYTATLDSVEVYDNNTNTWTLAPSMPTPRGDLMCTTLNSALVVIGGYYDPTGEATLQNVTTRMRMRIGAHAC